MCTIRKLTVTLLAHFTVGKIQNHQAHRAIKAKQQKHEREQQQQNQKSASTQCVCVCMLCLAAVDISALDINVYICAFVLLFSLFVFREPVTALAWPLQYSPGR